MKRSRISVLSVAGALAALAVYAFAVEPSRIRVVEHIVDAADEQEIFSRPLRIAVIADLHAGAPYINEAKIDRVIALTNAAKPDLILLTGDYVIQGVVGGEHMTIEKVAERLRSLSAPLGVFAALGNHDRWENADHIARVLTEAGIPVLENRSMPISPGLRLVGLSDTFTTTPNIAGALADVPDGARALLHTFPGHIPWTA